MRAETAGLPGVETTCGELFWPFRVMELMVISRPTTEGRGASSPVTNTLPACCDCAGGVVVEVEELDSQPTSVMVASNTKAKHAKSLFMPTSIIILGEQMSYEYETLAVRECRVTMVSVTGEGFNQRSLALAWVLRQLAWYVRKGPVRHVLLGLQL